MAALTRIFLSEIKRLFCEAAGGSCGDDAPAAPRPRPGAVSFLYRFGSAINRHVHLHACVTDGVFTQSSDGYSAKFFPARPITTADLATITERVRRRVVRWFRMQRFLDADVAADMLARENSGFSVDASVRITLIDRDVPSYFQSLEHLLRYCARPSGDREVGGGTSRRGTNRGHDSIAAFQVAPDGLLTLVQIVPSRGRGPQNLAITPAGDLLLCANMPGDNLAVFRINRETGRLALVGEPVTVKMPSCVAIVP